MVDQIDIVELPTVTIVNKTVLEDHRADPIVQYAHWSPDSGNWSEYPADLWLIHSLKDFRLLPEGKRILNPIELFQAFVWVRERLEQLFDTHAYVRGGVKCSAENTHYFSVQSDPEDFTVLHRPGYAGGSRAKILVTSLGTPGDTYESELRIDDGRTKPRGAKFRSIAKKDGQVVTLPDGKPVVTY